LRKRRQFNPRRTGGFWKGDHQRRTRDGCLHLCLVRRNRQRPAGISAKQGKGKLWGIHHVTTEVKVSRAGLSQGEQHLRREKEGQEKAARGCRAAHHCLISRKKGEIPKRTERSAKRPDVIWRPEETAEVSR